MKQKALWIHTFILAIVFVLMMNEQSRSGLPSLQTKSAGWEYKIVPIDLGTNIKSGEELINEYDAQGWELIAVHSLNTSPGNGFRYSGRGLIFGGDPASFKAIDRDGKVKAKKLIDKADALYIFKRQRGQ